MSTTVSYSAALVLRKDGGRSTICCRACGAPVSAADRNWRDAAVLREKPLRELDGPYRTSAEELLVRQFFCGECAALLDTEIALPGEPFLDDRIDA
jgi:acetone carboxylase gamma subunit